jgi:nucleotidyltransferase substrate binding protein (TIGR01987 family)
MSQKKKLDFSSLEKAVSTLELAVKTYLERKDSLDKTGGDLMRDGVIQRFEYTFELAWKTMKRYLEMYGLEKVDNLNNRDFFRSCFETGLIGDPEAWFGFLMDRNQTSHVYDQKIAGNVFESASRFISDAMFLVDQLKKRIK